jgi:hypothetical protein
MSNWRRFTSAVLLATVVLTAATIAVTEGDPVKNCCAKNDTCREVDNDTKCGTANACSGTYGYCCADACPGTEMG